MSVLPLVLMLSLIGVQSPPNYSGRWFIDKAAMQPSQARPFWPMCGWECTITQSAVSLTVAPETGPRRTILIAEKPVTTAIEGFGQVTTQTISARWDGQQLVVTVVTGRGDDFTATTRLALSGGRLVVTTTRSANGRGGVQESASYTRK